MADLTFNTNEGQAIAREQQIAYLNTGTKAAPAWSPLGYRVEDSSEEYDWGDETAKDILGNTFSTMKKPVITQSFEPLLDAGQEALLKIWNLGVKDQDAQALANQDMLIIHLYAGTTDAAFAERYESCMIKPTGLGGAGGGNISMPIDVTYGGKRTTGTAAKQGDTVTFTAA